MTPNSGSLSEADGALLVKLRASPGSSPAERRPSVPDDAVLVSEKGQHLRIIGMFDSGGMGEIYLAHHQEFSQVVVVKVPKLECTEAGGAERFLHREQRFPSDLVHPNLVSSLDRGTLGKRPFVVMEYVAGRNLAAIIAARGPLPWGEASRLIAQVASGLAAAHRRGIIHRDLKPQNLILADNGQIKILDWGLLRFTRAADPAAPTEDGALLGTPDFAAPEQMADPRRADERSDLYGLGCTYFFLLTGRPPFWVTGKESLAGVLIAHASAPRPSLRKIRGDIPRRVQSMIHKLMDPEPQKRFTSVVQFQKRLRAALAWGAIGILWAAHRKYLEEFRTNHPVIGVLGQPGAYLFQALFAATFGVILLGVLGLSVDRLWVLDKKKDSSPSVEKEEPAVTQTTLQGDKVVIPAEIAQQYPLFVDLVANSGKLTGPEKTSLFHRCRGMLPVEREYEAILLTKGDGDRLLFPSTQAIFVAPGPLAFVLMTDTMDNATRNEVILRFCIQLYREMHSDNPTGQAMNEILRISLQNRIKGDEPSSDDYEAVIAPLLRHTNDMIDATNDRDAFARLCAVIALGCRRTHPPTIIPVLQKRLNDDDPKVRRVAAAALRMYDPAVSEVSHR